METGTRKTDLITLGLIPRRLRCHSGESRNPETGCQRTLA